MRITIEQSTLRQALEQIAGAIAAKPLLPILGNCLIQFEGSAATLTANSTEIAIRARTAAGLITKDSCLLDEGTTTAPFRTLLELVRSAPEGPIEMQGTADRLVVLLADGKYTLPVLPPEDFPQLQPEEDGLVPLAIDSLVGFESVETFGTALGQALDQVAYCLASDPVQPALGGVLWERNAAGLALVGTDGHRLAYAQFVNGPVVPLANSTAVVPGEAIARISKMLHNDQLVQILTSPRRILVETITSEQMTTTLMANLLDCQYPKYRTILPTANPARLQVERVPFLASLRRIVAVSSAITQAVSVQIEEGQVVLESSDAEKGSQGREQVSAQSTGCDGLTISFNAAYLVGLLRNLTTRHVAIYLKDERSPVLVQEVYEEKVEGQVELRNVLMPLRP